MGTISANFSFSEFEKSETAERYGICNVITDFDVRNAIVALVREVLQPLRTRWGKPLKVNSGYRSQQLNMMVGGSPSSQHKKGEAADIATDYPLKLAQMAKDMNLPYDQMILYPNFLHLSHKLHGEQRRQILYNVRYKGKKVQ